MKNSALIKENFQNTFSINTHLGDIEFTPAKGGFYLDSLRFPEAIYDFILDFFPKEFNWDYSELGDGDATISFNHGKRPSFEGAFNLFTMELDIADGNYANTIEEGLKHFYFDRKIYWEEDNFPIWDAKDNFNDGSFNPYHHEARFSEILLNILAALGYTFLSTGTEIFFNDEDGIIEDYAKDQAEWTIKFTGKEK